MEEIEMKIYYSFIFYITLFICSTAFADSYYYYHGKQIPFSQNTEKISVRFKDQVSLAERISLTKKFTFLKEFKEEFNLVPKGLDVGDWELAEQAILELKESSTPKEISNLILNLNQEKIIELAEPIYKTEKSDFYLYGKIVVRFEDTISESEVNAVANEFGLTIIRSRIWNENIYDFWISKNTALTSLEVANKIFEKGIAVYSLPDFMQTNWLDDPNDPFFPNQWHLKNEGTPIQYSGTPGADLNVINAWTVTEGDSNIIVAIVDTGVDTGHPDLQGQLVPGYDFAGNDFDPYPSDGNAHGTACAGIVVAKADNNLGVSGVAPKCKVMPMRASMVGTSASTMTRSEAIHAAADSGASIISNSWQTNGVFYQFLEDAVIYAKNTGRNGLGCVIFWSAGNDSFTQIPWPKNMGEVISVAAMSMCDERKSFNSCDNETWWGSTHGDSLDMATPGVKIYTTDISGSAGYENGDYTPDFNGTSSACPNAAAVGALVLSAAPWLTSDEVQDVLESTADKPQGYNFQAGFPNGTWNNELGYGRLNAYQAVLQAGGATLTGIITDSTGSPISGVSIATSNKIFKTDSLGVYELKTAPGIQDISFYKLGFEKLTVNFDLVLNQVAQFDTTLLASATGNFSGMVLDEITNEGVLCEFELHFQIESENLFVKTKTDSFGFFDFPNLAISDSNYVSYNSIKIIPGFNYSETTINDTIIIFSGVNIPNSYFVGRTKIMLVDDDNGNDFELPYKMALDSLGISFLHWDVAKRGEIQSDTLDLLFERNVIWFTGLENSPVLDSNNIATLDSFLTKGGNLLLSGMSVSNDIQGSNLSNFIGATINPIGSTNSFVKGTSHPIGDGKLYSVSTPNQGFKDAFNVTNAQVVANYGVTGNFDAAIVANETQNSKIVLSGFEIGGLFDLNGNPSISTIDTMLAKIIFWWDFSTDISELSFEKPLSYELAQNFPNPFNPSTKISFTLPKSEFAKVLVYNTKGQLVKTLFSGEAKFGKNSVIWNGQNENNKLVSSGVYFYRLETDNFSQTQKMLFLK
ncbi:MAG: T9SS C-terminal target domain-containing protein [Calditrichaeota bacterium]|nr:MAG: T9SS C-terminal target domain-containing protein [Calditrichota bacterium]